MIGVEGIENSLPTGYREDTEAVQLPLKHQFLLPFLMHTKALLWERGFGGA